MAAVVRCAVAVVGVEICEGGVRGLQGPPVEGGAGVLHVAGWVGEIALFDWKRAGVSACGRGGGLGAGRGREGAVCLVGGEGRRGVVCAW